MSDTISVEAFREQARAWLAENLEPIGPVKAKLRGVDNLTAEDFPAERSLQRQLHEAGYAGITYPTEYGGQGLSAAHETAFLEEAAGYRMPDFGVLGGTTFLVCAPTMLAHATPEFLASHVPRMLAGDELVAQFFSEPSAGSDLAGVTTRADRDGDGWVLNGSKVWSSGAAHADWGMCLARTNWDVPKHRGLTWFAVPCHAPGLRIDPIMEINGDDEFCQEFLDDVRVPDADRIGEVDAGWSVTQTMLAFERGAGRPTAEEPTSSSTVTIFHTMSERRRRGSHHERQARITERNLRAANDPTWAGPPARLLREPACRSRPPRGRT